MDFTFTTQLHYLIHFVDGEYVAHCLDADLVGTGKTQKEALVELNTAVRALVFYAVQTEVFDIMSLCKQAPERYWLKYEDAKRKNGSKECVLDCSPQVPPVNVSQAEANRVPVIPIFTKREFTYCVAELGMAA